MQYWNNEEERLAQWQLAAAELPSDVAEWLEWLRDYPGVDAPPVQIDADGKWRLAADDTPAWTKTLVFHDVETRGDSDFETIRSAELTNTKDGYLLEVLGYCEDESDSNHQIFFSGATVETSFFDYARSAAPGNNCPWESVGGALWWLLQKARQLGTETLNEQEKALLPLTDFQAAFRFADEAITITAEGAAVFAKYARAEGQEKVAATVESLAKQGPQKRTGRHIRRLLGMLGKKESESLWRRIAEDVHSATAAYPVKYADHVDEKSLDRERKNITKAIRNHGFLGDYPNFSCRSKLMGVHLRSVRGIAQFVGFGKTMDSHIHCAERYNSDGRITVDYITSAVFPQEVSADSKSDTDAYSGFFADENRRFGTAFSPAPPRWEGEDFVYQNNAEIAVLATKTAQLTRLTKSECQKVTNTQNAVGFLVVMALFCGVAFGALMTIGMGLVSVLVGGIVVLLTDRDLSLLPGLVAGLPWLKLFLLTGGGFGVLTFVISALSQKRSLNR